MRQCTKIESEERQQKEVHIMGKRDEKLCVVSDETLLRDMSRNAEVMCARCGAKSHIKANICEPIAIEPDH